MTEVHVALRDVKAKNCKDVSDAVNGNGVSLVSVHKKRVREGKKRIQIALMTNKCQEAILLRLKGKAAKADELPGAMRKPDEEIEIPKFREHIDLQRKVNPMC